jgi:hypothetical protein
MNQNTNQNRRYPEIVLIGPTAAGKTTVSELLGAQLNLPVICLDEIAERYYEEVGFGEDVTKRMMKERGFGYMYRQLAPALAHATVRMIQDHETGIMDLGAGHSHFADAALFERVRQALALCPNVVLLLPCPDLDQSAQILRARCKAERGWDWRVDGYDYIEHWVKDDCNHLLATLTVYTDGCTPERTCEEIRLKAIKRMREIGT